MTTSATLISRTSSTSGYAVSLRAVFPELFATLATPKADELVATRYRHGSKDAAETFFIDWDDAGDAAARRASASRLSRHHLLCFQTVRKKSRWRRTTSTGWETFLEAVHQAGFQLSGTWPMRTEYEVIARLQQVPMPSPPASSSFAKSVLLMRLLFLGENFCGS